MRPDPAKRPGPRADVDHLIAALSEHLHVPAPQVGEIYWEQLDRLSAQARITDFLVILALRNARTILRARGSTKAVTHPQSSAAHHRFGLGTRQATRATEPSSPSHHDSNRAHSTRSAKLATELAGV